MQFNITFKTIFEYILKKVVLFIQIRFVSTKKIRASPRVHLVKHCKCTIFMRKGNGMEKMILVPVTMTEQTNTFIFINKAYSKLTDVNLVFLQGCNYRQYL